MSDPTYELYYWPGLPGRGEFIRLAFHAAGVPFIDVARLPKDQGGGPEAIARLLRGDLPGLRPFAPPILKTGTLLIAQVAAILHYLAPRFGLIPDEEDARARALQLQLTVADLVSEVHDTHHPVSTTLTYEQQIPEAKKRSALFLSQRLPRFLTYFEDNLTRNPDAPGKHFFGRSISYVDLSVFQVLSGLEYAFPAGLAAVKPKIPGLLSLQSTVARHPRIAAYLATPERLPFNEHGIFRRYPDLDLQPSST